MNRITISRRRRRFGTLAALSFIVLAVGATTVQRGGALPGGSLTAWGQDYYGTVANTPTDSDFVQVSAGYVHSLALRQNGTIAAWGSDYYGQVSNTPTGSDFVQVNAGYQTSIALRSNGTIAAWGFDNLGQVSNAPTGSDFVQVTGNAYTYAALRSDGSIVTWGWDATVNGSNTPTGTGFTKVSAGYDHMVAVKSDGSLVSWGANSSTQVSNTPTGTGFVDANAGFMLSSALRSDGTLVSWGGDLNGQVSSTPSTGGFTRVSVGAYGTSAALRSDGTLAVWGRNDSGQVSNRPTDGGYTQISVGGNHLVAVKSASQTISFPALGTVATTSAPVALQATASSGLPVSYESLTTDICTVNGSVVTLTGTPGTCSVEATQAGDSNFPPATPVQQSFQVTAPAVAFRLGDVSVNEGSGPNATTVSVMFGTDRPVSEPLCVWYSTTDGTATGADRLVAFNGTQDYLRLGVSKPKFILLSANRTLGKLSTKVNYDSVAEADEDLTLAVSKVTAQEAGRCVASSVPDPRVKVVRGTGHVTILDDDTPIPTD